MLSRRKLFSMLLMMAVLFLLYMLTWVYRESVNDYDTNEYATEGSDIHRSDIRTLPGGEDAKKQRTVYIGEKDSDMGKMVAQWCAYRKRPLICFSSVKEYMDRLDADDEILCIAPECLAEPSDARLLSGLDGRDMVVVFGGLPETKLIKESPELCKLLGIEEIRSEQTKLSGVYLYEGFLLGGEALYRTDMGEEFGQGLDLSIPWYKLSDGTKTYMTGLTGTVEEDAGQGERPSILWRNTTGNTTVFAVNGDYLNGGIGLGLLEAMMAESHSYLLYPVINAQNLTVVGYPSFASENEKELKHIYANSHKMLLQNIIWPSLVSVSEQSGFRMTCFLTPQLSYLDKTEPETEDLVYYLRQMKERQGEMGWSAHSKDSVSVKDKWNRDMEFFEEAESSYAYTAAYASGRETQQCLEVMKAGGMSDIRTLTGIADEGNALLSFISEDITYQGITHRADQYSFLDDLRNRSFQTALGYTNILLDMGGVTWPETKEERWENYSRRISGNIGTWWKPYSDFDKTTLTESDSRLRSFLALGYEDSQEDGVIRLKLKNRRGTVSFLLRAHDKNVKSVSGGTAAKIEEDIWLLSAAEDEVQIELSNQ